MQNIVHMVKSMRSAAMLAFGIGVTVLPCTATADEIVVSAASPTDLESAGQGAIVQSFPWDFQFPSIVRFRELPLRLMHEPNLEDPTILQYRPDLFQETCERCFLTASDQEIRIVAVQQLARLARVAGLDDFDFSKVSPSILKELQTTTDREMFWACLSFIRDAQLAQAADALTELSASSSDDVLRIVDPLLIKWSHQPAVSVWEARLESSNSTALSKLLACQGLAQLGGKKSASVASLVTDSTATYQLRSTAAEALCVLNSEEARKIAARIISGSTRQKLMALRLLDHNHPEAMDSAFSLCSDDVAGVATAAWEIVEMHTPERLLPLLDKGVLHAESGIRTCCCRVIQRYPTPERIELMAGLLGDQHLIVRNTCRASYASIAKDDSKFSDQIVALIATRLNNDQSSWQLLEQCCYALAKLRRPEFAERCLVLCDHSQPEVFIAAAWLYHLMPDPSLNDLLAKTVQNRIAVVAGNRTHPNYQDIDRQVGFLLQAAGYAGCKDLLPIMKKQLNKASDLYEYGRSAGIWALGAILEGSQDKAITTSLLQRLNDRDSPLDPEFESVRCNAAQALGRINDPNAIPDLKVAFEIDRVDSYLPQTARWALQRMGEPSPGEIESLLDPIGGWQLLPIDERLLVR